jgi:hypothetical protein
VGNPILKLLNFIASRLDYRVIHGEDRTPYLYRGYLWGWRPPVQCPSCEGQGYDYGGSLTLVGLDTHPDHPLARSCGHCGGKGKLEYQRKSKTNLDDAPHSHPWPWSISLVLWGGYTEERIHVEDESDPNSVQSTDVVRRRVWPLTLNVFGPGDYHNVTKLHGRETWSLFLTGPKAMSWGFWVFGRGHVEWRARLKERGIDVKEEV